MRKFARLTTAAVLAICAAAISGEADPPQDRLPGGALVNLGKLKNAPEKVTLAPGGGMLAAVDDSGRIYLYDTKQSKKLREFDAGGPCHVIEFTTDGKQLISAGPGSDISVWTVETGKLARKLEGSEKELCAVALSNDGKRLASTDQSGALRIWDFDSGKTIFNLKPSREKDDPEGAFSEGLVFSPDGRFIVTESNDVKARSWDAVRGVELQVVRDHDNTNQGGIPISVAPGGGLVATTRNNGIVRLWRIDSGEMERVISGHAAEISCAAFTPDGLTLLTGSQDRTIRQWDVESGLEMRRFACQAKPISIAVTPDGMSFYTVDDDSRVLKWTLTGAPDGFEPAPPLPELSVAWEKLDSPKYETRSTGVWIYLLSDSQKAAADLHTRLTEFMSPSAAEDAKQARELIAKLDDTHFDARTNAFSELRAMKGKARAALIDTLRAPPSSEVRHRAGLLLSELGIPNGARDNLALEILGTMHSSAAKDVLTRLSKLDGPLAARARAVLARMWSN